MANIIDYVKASTATFDEKPLNRVDSLVLSWIAYMRIPEEVPESATAAGVRLGDLIDKVNVLGLVAPVYDPKSSEELLRACVASPRFADLAISHAADEWSREAEKQFSAVAFGLPGGTYLAYRGTDDTLVGWKENLQMAYRDAIPAQAEARAYLERVASQVEGPLWLGGHSKGGNLAVFAMMTCRDTVRARVERCFAHDAPGFTAETVGAHDWAHAEELVDSTIPEESIVGLLLGGCDIDPLVVKSTNPGLLQHAPFSWVVEGDDFAKAGSVAYDTYRTNKRVNAWMKAMSSADRERFIEILYKLVEATGEVTLSGMIDSVKNDSGQFVLRRLDGLPDDQRAFFLEAVEDLVATLLLGPAPANPQTPTEKAEAATDKVDDITARFNDRISKIDKYLGL